MAKCFRVIRMKKTVLIVGGSGFVGQTLTSHFLKHGMRVVWITRKPVTSPPSVKTVVGWPSNRWLSSCGKISGLVILNNTTVNKQFPTKASEILDTHLQVPLQMTNEAVQRGISPIIYFSTGSVYVEKPVLKVGQPFDNKSDFFISAKFGAEHLLKHYSRFATIHLVRLFRPYGPGFGGSLINHLLTNLYNRKPIDLLGGEGPRMQPVHLWDVARITLSLLSCSESMRL